MEIIKQIPKDAFTQQLLLTNLQTDNSNYKISCTKLLDYYIAKNYKATNLEKLLLPELIKITQLTQSAIKIINGWSLVHNIRTIIEIALRKNEVYYVIPTDLQGFLYNVSNPIILYISPRAIAEWPYIPISNVKIPTKKLLPNDIDYILKVWLYLQNTNCTQAQQELKENCYNALREINFKIPRPLQGLIHDFT